jgi:hypothetical protein
MVRSSQYLSETFLLSSLNVVYLMNGSIRTEVLHVKKSGSHFLAFDNLTMADFLRGLRNVTGLPVLQHV